MAAVPALPGVRSNGQHEAEEAEEDRPRTQPKPPYLSRIAFWTNHRRGCRRFWLGGEDLAGFRNVILGHGELHSADGVGPKPIDADRVFVQDLARDAGGLQPSSGDVGGGRILKRRDDSDVLPRNRGSMTDVGTWMPARSIEIVRLGTTARLQQVGDQCSAAASRPWVTRAFSM